MPPDTGSSLATLALLVESALGSPAVLAAIATVLVGTLSGSILFAVRRVKAPPRESDEPSAVVGPHRDSLTLLPNRRRFFVQLARVLSSASASKREMALFCLSLDDLERVNGSLGHAAGDELLGGIAERLGEVVAEGASFARLGGGEFALIAPRLSSTDEIGQVAERILHGIAEPIGLGGHVVNCTASIGIAVFPRDGRNLDTLFEHASDARCAARRAGGSRFELYQESFTRERERASQLDEHLRHALEYQELHLEYQPKVDLEARTVVGFESLLRWHSESVGNVSPREFIPVAESGGLLGEIGSWCLREVCAQIATWRDEGYKLVPISVNLLGTEFSQADLRSVVSEAVMEAGIEPELLELELSERAWLGRDDITAACLAELRAAGVRLALDELGPAASALDGDDAPAIDSIKVGNAQFQQEEDGTAAALVARAHSLGLQVVAMCVDAEVQLERLHEAECDQVQGFVFSPALPAQEASRYLARRGEAPPNVDLQDADLPGLITTRAPVGKAAVAAPKQAASEERRALLLDDEEKSLASLALRLMRLGFDTHYINDVAEAQLLISQEGARIGLIITSPQVDLDALGGLLRQLGAALDGTRPRLVIAGEEPDAARRAMLREAGTSWVLWAPFDDAELRFMMSSALARPEELADRKEVRVPTNLTVRLRTGSRRETAVLSTLSARGAFIELSDPLSPGSWLRLEFEFDRMLVRGFASVEHQQPEEADDRTSAPSGMDVVFRDMGEEATATLREAVQSRAARYLP
jgi:diguanylate cyclase (GGDEF)-like protein